jgi:UDP-N-acetyl-D-mannosaminuronate dehydrogenase
MIGRSRELNHLVGFFVIEMTKTAMYNANINFKKETVFGITKQKEGEDLL